MSTIAAGSPGDVRAKGVLGEESDFEVVPFPMSCYREHRRNQVTADIEADTAEICRQLARLGATTFTWQVPAKRRDKTRTENRLRLWSEDDRPRDTALVWVGHGGSNGGNSWLWVGGTPAGDQSSVDEPTADLRLYSHEFATYLYEQATLRHSWSAKPAHWSMVFIQACGAAGVARRLMSQLIGQSEIAGDGLLIVACGKELGNAYPGQLPVVLGAAIDSLTENTTAVSLRDLATALEDRMRGIGKIYKGDLGDVRDISRVTRLPDPVAAPWNAYQELTLNLTDMASGDLETLSHAATGTRLGELAWRFVGRAEERETIFRWLRGQSAGLLVVTGPEGVGKSALLGNLDVHSRPAVRTWLEGAGLVEAAPDGTPTVPTFDVSLTLDAGSVQDLLAGLNDGLGLGLGPGPWRVDDVREAIRAGRAAPVTVLADGLDQAREQPEIREALRHLTAAAPVRVVLASREWNRPTVTPGSDDAAARVSEEILPLERDPRAIETYVRQCLLGVTDPVEDEMLRDRVAALVASAGGNAERQFLYASLAVYEILADVSILGDHERLTALLADDEEALFRAALMRMTTVAPQVRPYLAALALAQGRGIPRSDGAWTAAALALATPAEQPEVKETGLDEVLAVAAPYILLDVEDDVAVYRLTHKAFAPVLLPPDEAGLHRAQLALVRSLVSLAVRSAPSLSHYLTRYLPVHAAAAGPEGWRALAADLSVLDAVDPWVVAAEAVRSGQVAALPVPVLGTASTAHLAADSDGAERQALRALGALYVTGGFLPESVGSPAGGAPWFPLWARTRPQLLAVTLDAGSARIRALAALRDADGREALVTGDAAGRIRLWDLRRARATELSWTSRGRSPVHSLAVGRLPDRRLVLATADRQRVVQLCELGTGTQLMRVDYDGDVAAVHLVPDSEGRMVLITVRYDGRLEFRPVELPAPEHPVDRQARGTITASAAAAATSRGPGLVVVASSNGRLEVWTADGRLIRHEQTDHGPIRHLAAYFAVDGTLLVAIRTPDALHIGQVGGPWRNLDLADLTGLWPSSEDPVCFLPMTTGTPIVATVVDQYLFVADAAPGPDNASLNGQGLAAYVGDVADMAATDGEDGTPLIAAASTDGTLRLAPPLTARNAGGEGAATVTSLAVAALADRPLLASGGRDGRVVVRDLRDGGQRWTEARSGSVHGLGLAGPDRSVLIVAWPGGIEAWNLVTRGPVDVTFPSLLPEILGVAPLNHPARDFLVVTLHRDDRLRCVDLGSGDLVDQVHLDHPGHWTLIAPAVTASGDPAVMVGGSTGLFLWSPCGPLQLVRDGVQVTSLGTVTRGMATNGTVWGQQDGTVVMPRPGAVALPTMPCHAHRVTAVAGLARAETERLVSGDESGLVLVEDLTGRGPQRGFRVGRPVTALELHDDLVVVGTLDGVVTVTVPEMGEITCMDGRNEERR